MQVSIDRLNHVCSQPNLKTQRKKNFSKYFIKSLKEKKTQKGFIS